MDFARQSGEDSKRFLAAHNINFIERYVKSECAIKFKFGIGAADCGYNLLFFAIPAGRRKSDMKFAVGGSFYGHRLTPQQPYPNWREHPVFVTDAYLVQGPEEVVPSLVWLEPTKQVPDLLRNILGVSKRVFEVRFGLGEREVAVPGINRTAGNRDGVPCGIECFPQVVGSIANYFGKSGRQWLDDLNFVNELVGKVRVSLSDTFVGAALLESVHSDLEIPNVLLCPCEFAP